jgi:hypothetical protein
VQRKFHLRGYIAMLAVEHAYRKFGLGMCRRRFLKSLRMYLVQSVWSEERRSRMLSMFSGSELVVRAVRSMHQRGCKEVMLETEVTNTAALALYLRLGFLKDKRLLRYYLNSNDAFRLKLWLEATDPLVAPLPAATATATATATNAFPPPSDAAATVSGPRKPA